MPRKQRIEYPEATYQMIGRGNDRNDLFVQEGSGVVFEEMIFEVDRCWSMGATNQVSTLVDA